MCRSSFQFALSATLAVSLVVSYAFAQAGRDCDPNPNKSQLHHENCKC